MIRTTNIRRVIDRLMRHPMMQDLPFESAVEYTVDFIALMGTPALYDEKTAVIKIDNWRGELPCDFVNMIQVRIAQTQCDGRKAPYGMYRYSGNSFHMSSDKPHDNMVGLTYKIQGMAIFTSTKDTDIEIAYRAFAVDDEGYPLIPDNPVFMKGLESYIKLQWFTIKYDMGQIAHDVYANAQRDYAWYAGNAHSEMNMPSVDQAETLFNSFKTLLPRNNEHWKGFFTNGAREIWKH